MDFFINTTLKQYRLDRTSFPNQAVTMYIGSIARTNLETDLVQRGGSLVTASAQQRGAAASASASSSSSPQQPNTHTNKPKFCFSE